MRSGNSLIIGTPYVETRIDGKVRLCSDVTIEGETKTIWLEVEEKYAQYLCSERSDAFVIGLLPVAMRRCLDVVSSVPISERLKFQLSSTLLPLLARYGTDIHEVQIKAPVACEPIQSIGAVGTGISCGVDSLHVLKRLSKGGYSGLRLTHLVLNNVGAFGQNGVNNQYAWTKELAKKFCAEYGYNLLVTDSNIYETTELDFELQHTYLNMFSVFCLQKLWGVFFYGSTGIDFLKGFTLKEHEKHACGCYDIVTLNCFSTETLRLYSEGVAYERLDKMAHIADYEPAQKYLQVCVRGRGKNCGRCVKCVRTLLILDYLGALDKFAAVFDVDDYRKNRRWYLKHLYRCARFKLDYRMLDPIYDKFMNEITLWMKVSAIYQHLLYCTKVMLRPTFEKLGILKPLS